MAAFIAGQQHMPLRNGTVVGQVVLPQQNWPRFEQGVGLVFNKWMALRLAVENEWGGRDSQQKADELIDDVLHWFTSKREHYADDLEIMLEETLQVEFNVEVEDGSPLEIARQLVDIYKQCLSGDFSTIDRLQRQAAPPTSACGAAACEEAEQDESSSTGDEEEEDAMDVDEPPTPVPIRQPVVDDDGFQMVQRRGRQR